MKTHLFLLAGLLVLAPQTRSQETLPDAAKTLSGADIVGPFVSQALQSNPALSAAENRYEAARASIDFAGALPNPRIQLTHFVESIQTRTGPQRQAISLQQPIPAFGSRDSRRAIAQSQSLALWHAYAVQQFELVDKLSAKVLEIAFLQKKSEITDLNIGLLTRLESIVEAKVKAGGELRDLLRIQLEKETATDRLAKQQTEIRVATNQLQSLLGQSPSDATLAIELRPPSPLTSDPSQWITTLQAAPPPQISILHQLQSSQAAKLRLANSASKPDFSIGLNYIRTGDSLNPSTPDNGQDPWAIMVGASLPIWGKANRAQSIQATLEGDAITHQIEDLNNSLAAETRSWITRLEDSQARIQRYDTSLLPLARQSREITETAYRSGTASILDLIDADRTLLSLETEYWRAAADAWQARWKLATITGGLWLD